MQLTAFTALALVIVAAGPASAQEAKRVVLAPISTLGAEATSEHTAQIETAMSAALGAVPGFATEPMKELRRAIRKAKRSDLKACDGDSACLAELGELAGGQLVVYGELGGLGDAQVLALKLVDVAAKREIRSTTVQFGATGSLESEARGAAYRLLAPGLYIGTLALQIDIEGATIFLDGDKVATSPAAPIQAEVGNHALRVTHPEYRDFVRFVDVRFDETTELQIDMKAFPIVEDEMRQQGKTIGGALDSGPRRQRPTPWYRRWYTVAGAGALVFVGSALVVGMLADGIDSDREEIVGE